MPQLCDVASFASDERNCGNRASPIVQNCEQSERFCTTFAYHAPYSLWRIYAVVRCWAWLLNANVLIEVSGFIETFFIIRILFNLSKTCFFNQIQKFSSFKWVEN